MSQYVKLSRNIVVNSKLFRTNEEYLLEESIVKLEGCGCNGVQKKSVLYYKITVNEKSYEINNKYATIVERSVPLNPLSPDEFHSSMRGTLHTNVGRNYDEIRNKPDLNKIWESVNNVPM